MKIAIVVSVLIGVAIGLWQKTELAHLNRLETRERENAERELAVERILDAEQSKTPAPATGRAAVSVEELEKFTTDILSIRAEFETNLWHKQEYETGVESNATADTLSRLTSEQLKSVLEAWERTAAAGDEHRTGIHRFMLGAGTINPQASLEVMHQLSLERRKDGVPGYSEGAFDAWFKQNPAALLRWSQSIKGSGGLAKESVLWGNAAMVLLDPTPEHISRFLPYIRVAVSSAQAISRQLPDHAARLAFFQSYHTATGGVSDDLGVFVWPLAQKIPFTEVAQIADAVAPFLPSVPEGKNYDGETIPLGSLRFAVALMSRDGTPEQRWNWLVKRPSDRPTGKVLSYTVSQWCERDYREVAV